MQLNNKALLLQDACWYPKKPWDCDFYDVNYARVCLPKSRVIKKVTIKRRTKPLIRVPIAVVFNIKGKD